MKSISTTTIAKERERSSKPKAASKALSYETLFEDDHIIALAKPAGLLTLPDRFNAALPNLRTMLKERFGEIFVVHRIDRETSGVMLFAKNAAAHKILSEQFETRRVRKFYHAVVQGRFEQDEMAIDIPLLADPSRAGLVAPSVRGKESLTQVRILKRFRLATLLECELITGRQHQIRVHCAAVGHPLLVDADYGERSEFFLSGIKRKYNVGKHQEEQPLVSRNTLHAFRVEFSHPASQEVMRIEAPYPKDFKALVQMLDKYSSYRQITLAGSLQGSLQSSLQSNLQTQRQTSDTDDTLDWEQF
jgi:23S rRNA pseudouridine1911/1915/1917 synthase